PHIPVFYQETIYLKPQYEQLIKKKGDQVKQIIIQAISEGKACGEFREDLSVEMTSMPILSRMNWTYKWYQPSGPKAIEDIGEAFIDFILHGLLQVETLSSDAYEQVLIGKYL